MTHGGSIIVVQWWFFVPFGKRGRVLDTLPVNHSQCPFIQMTDTDVTFLSCYNIVDMMSFGKVAKKNKEGGWPP